MFVAIDMVFMLKPKIINVHAQGGRSMLVAAREAMVEEANKISISQPLLLGVTVLTSIDDKDLKEIGINSTSMDQVKRLASLCQEAGLDGIVCSAREIRALRKICGNEFKLLTPGIRPNWAANNDQKRIVTPGEAIKLGADYLVIGRPIYGAKNPVTATKKIIAEISEIVS